MVEVFKAGVVGEQDETPYKLLLDKIMPKLNKEREQERILIITDNSAYETKRTAYDELLNQIMTKLNKEREQETVFNFPNMSSIHK